MHEGSIDWKHISEDDFNRVVEALLMRKFHRPPASTAEVIDGRGGDGGIDVAVYVDDKINQIFSSSISQRGFPEGSGTSGAGRSRNPLTPPGRITSPLYGHWSCPAIQQ